FSRHDARPSYGAAVFAGRTSAGPVLRCLWPELVGRNVPVSFLRRSTRNATSSIGEGRGPCGSVRNPNLSGQYGGVCTRTTHHRLAKEKNPDHEHTRRA